MSHLDHSLLLGPGADDTLRWNVGRPDGRLRPEALARLLARSRDPAPWVGEAARRASGDLESTLLLRRRAEAAPSSDLDHSLAEWFPDLPPTGAELAPVDAEPMVPRAACDLDHSLAEWFPDLQARSATSDAEPVTLRATSDLAHSLAERLPAWALADAVRSPSAQRPVAPPPPTPSRPRVATALELVPSVVLGVIALLAALLGIPLYVVGCPVWAVTTFIALALSLPGLLASWRDGSVAGRALSGVALACSCPPLVGIAVVLGGSLLVGEVLERLRSRRRS